VQGDDVEDGEDGAQEGEEEGDGSRVLEKYVGVRVRHRGAAGGGGTGSRRCSVIMHPDHNNARQHVMQQ
jgi:hypothetical protein